MSNMSERRVRELPPHNFPHSGPLFDPPGELSEVGKEIWDVDGPAAGFINETVFDGEERQRINPIERVRVGACTIALPERKDVPPFVFNKLALFFANREFWYRLRDQKQNGDPDLRFGVFEHEYEPANEVVTALRDHEVMFTDVFRVALNVSRARNRHHAREDTHRHDAKKVAVEFKLYADREFYQTEEVPRERLEKIIDEYYDEKIRRGEKGQKAA